MALRAKATKSLCFAIMRIVNPAILSVKPNVKYFVKITDSLEELFAKVVEELQQDTRRTIIIL